MLNQKEILSTIEMIAQQHLDIRTITMGISLLDCADPDARRACDKIYDKITRRAERQFYKMSHFEAFHEEDRIFLNRLSDYCFMLMRAEDFSVAKKSATLV